MYSKNYADRAVAGKTISLKLSQKIPLQEAQEHPAAGKKRYLWGPEVQSAGQCSTLVAKQSKKAKYQVGNEFVRGMYFSVGGRIVAFGMQDESIESSMNSANDASANCKAA